MTLIYLWDIFEGLILKIKISKKVGNYCSLKKLNSWNLEMNFEYAE